MPLGEDRPWSRFLRLWDNIRSLGHVDVAHTEESCVELERLYGKLQDEQKAHRVTASRVCEAEQTLKMYNARICKAEKEILHLRETLDKLLMERASGTNVIRD